ncbi:LysR family transcriptional regulator [Rathayibacter rathayi]|uniref:Transcriptional regulator n=1 Tax=Rathayibacter rathayi TaxID=33887 RepID=A0ABX5AJJ2_RATRA|nr:LysR family transcriptional regulator [Rathayibacter rathayi]PPF25557.1 transcriptional regulator [Rathayibacter rathayi]PPF51861.1 transcriptional regulator [Rathayibacter rathayi]PPG96360.1 transcriptional regulator [Rathayibacter rathayi]PPH39414.1 transcriptional regulator [Rathayibacter rathayi]PPH70412.1 transcriptional regulator [Rathayibacter rathayi]
MTARLEDISVRHLQYALAVEAAGSITGAAETLRIAQPSVSQQIRKLEARLGTPLFERTRTGLTVTPGARDFLRTASLLLGGLHEAAARLNDVASPWRVGISPGLCRDVVAEVEAALHSVQPDARMQCSADSSSAMIRALERGTLDVAVVRSPVGEPFLVHAPLASNELGVVVGPQHPLANEAGITWDHVREFALLWFDDENAPNYAAEILAHLARNGWSPTLERGPARHALFQHRLMTDHVLVALRPAGTRGSAAPLCWIPFVEDPPLEHLVLVAMRGTRAGALVARLGAAPRQ